ncbi:hypothetical protein SAMN05444396_10415 [Flavobacterium segetis]|uniref:Uncharacterized protein n=1 Tax=Flavobacterium segetis TaxID=271157 RepID=A0A1M5GLX6_9FLAO|nr:hypothetical protein [Flavobacterium segetis]SHG04668.1 hypothetical protein SAMN05444396_10415 [Flavobacterium segetis]
MKYLKLQLLLLLVLITLISCKSENELKAQKVTKDYVSFIDSVRKGDNDHAIANWSAIAREYDMKLIKLNLEIDKLEDNTIFDKKINAATAQYESFRNKIFEKKLSLEKEQESIL